MTRIGRNRTWPATWVAAIGVGAMVLLGVANKPAEPTTAQTATVDYGADVRPILVRSCLACHGFDPSTREANLRLDTFQGATAPRRHGQAIVPGDPASSLLIQRVTATDPHDRMPLEADPLSDEEVQTLRTWIAQGASYDVHWSLKPLAPFDPPAVEPSEWRANPIDAFILQALQDAGLEPAPLADRRTLIRRASFDLTGLPPTPEQVRDFLEDDSPQAYERVIDRLLASPRFGERWGRHWLDLARYAETYGHEFDYPIRNAWQYRDYVIRALNADLPYDQFVIEQIAGDLLDDPRRHPTMGFNESIIGTGIWWLSQGTHGPVDVRQDEADRIDNQIDVLSKSFLATTVSCARCHDHKFDPIYTREYYALAGFFQSSRRQDAYLDPHGAIDDAATAMSDLHAQARTQLDATARPTLLDAATGVGEHLLAASDVLFGRPAPGERVPSETNIIIESFDDLTYNRWTVEGDAFTDRPTRVGDDALASERTARGEGFANTHRRLEGEGSVDADQRVGTISREIVIQRDYLHFLIGGGRHPGKTGLRILVDGQAVREAAGFNSLHLRPERFDLTPWRGQTATIQIFDQVTGGWGNIRVDELVLSDEPSVDRPARRSVQAVAAERALNADNLEAWVRLLQDASGEADPFAPWLAAAEAAAGVPDAEIDAPTNPSTSDMTREVLETFDDPDAFDRWHESGWAFGGAPAGAGEWLTPASAPRLCEVNNADSGTLDDRLMGTLRSETFEITQPFIAIRARGRGMTRVIIDGYTMDEHNALLFNRCRLDINTDDWAWHVHDVDKYVGHHAHIEIIDDRADASIKVDRIEQISRDERPPARTWHQAGAGAATLADLAALYERAVAAGLTEADPFGLAVIDELTRSAWTMTPDADLAAAFAGIVGDCPTPIRVTAMEDGTGEDERVFIRGSHTTLGEVAERSFIGALCDDPTLDIDAGSGRLELAHKLLEDANPMPARVMVNRVWKHLMGRGIVESTDDFGLLGTSPTHPELLDHLAARFRTEMGWSTKTLIREIMLSRTYQMAAEPPTERARQVDPLNHLWSVREPRRLEGEAIRDAILQISGRLDTTMYGESVPIYLSPFMTGRGRPGKSGPLDGDGRRSIYLSVRRNFLSPMMTTFDAPNPHSSIGKRQVSNVPAQSLIMLNSPFVVQQSELLATELASIEDVDARLDRLFMLAIARTPTDDERAGAISFLDEQGEDHAAWTDLAHVVFNMKEFIFIE